MCFYEQYRFTCGDWRWGNFREHCNREYRMGETCGMKLVYQTSEQPSKCKYCEKADIKLRKRQQECDRIARWTREGKNPAAIDKSMDVIKQLDYEIQQIYDEISNRRQALGEHPRPQPQPSYVHNGRPQFRESLNQETPRKASDQTCSQQAYIGGTVSEQEMQQLQMRPLARHLLENRVQVVSGLRDAISEAKASSQSRCSTSDIESAKNIKKMAVEFPKGKDRYGLPVTLFREDAPATILSCADTGSKINAIQEDFATQTLGFTVTLHEDDTPEITQMANGKLISSCGRIETWCALDTAQNIYPFSGYTIIYVFKQLAEPFLVMGNEFLKLSETMSKYTSRLIKRQPASLHSPCVRSIGQPTQRLRCSLGGFPVEVFADTGSEVDAISRSYAEKHFKIQPSRREIRYADGSPGYTCGIIYTELAIGAEAPDIVQKSNHELPVTMKTTDNSASELSTQSGDVVAPSLADSKIRKVVVVELHVLEDLFTDVLIGEDALNVLQPYRYNPDDFLCNSHTPSTLCRITDVSGTCSKLKRKAEVQISRLLSGRSRTQPIDVEAQNLPTPAAITQQSNNEDQRENARREMQRRWISGFDGQKRDELEAKEVERQRGYDEERARRNQGPSRAD